MEKLLRVLKNWWVLIVGILGVILDSGFDVINPILLEIGINDKIVNILKGLFLIYGIYKAKIQLPSNNPDKVNDIVSEKFADADPIPGKGPKG